MLGDSFWLLFSLTPLKCISTHCSPQELRIVLRACHSHLLQIAINSPTTVLKKYICMHLQSQSSDLRSMVISILLCVQPQPQYAPPPHAGSFLKYVIHHFTYASTMLWYEEIFIDRGRVMFKMQGLFGSKNMILRSLFLSLVWIKVQPFNT